MKADLVRVRHMLDAAREILSFSAGKTRSDLDQDRMLSLSLVHLLEIIGEAASGVSADFRSDHPNISIGDPSATWYRGTADIHIRVFNQ